MTCNERKMMHRHNDKNFIINPRILQVHDHGSHSSTKTCARHALKFTLHLPMVTRDCSDSTNYVAKFFKKFQVQTNMYLRAKSLCSRVEPNGSDPLFAQVWYLLHIILRISNCPTHVNPNFLAPNVQFKFWFQVLSP